MADISKFRTKIDAIDNKIIQLLNERSAVVKQVGDIKAKSQPKNTCFIRPGREADMVRSIYSTFQDNLFPAKAAVQLWRTIINASLSLESNLTISIAGDDEVYWLTREYFSSFIPVSKKRTSDEVISDIAKGTHEVGVLSVADCRGLLSLPNDLKIFACIPFILQNNEQQIKALAFARLQPEETGKDATLIRIETNKKQTHDAIAQIFGRHKLNAVLIGNEDDAYLIEADGFMGGNHPVLTRIEKETGFAIKVLGNYAVPLKI